jgi:hypothetical protein
MRKAPIVLVLACLILLALPECQSDRVASPDDSDCRRPGRYEVGKEGGYRPCCRGLSEVPYESPGSDGTTGAPVCGPLPLNAYACLKGTCGDGICEHAEAPRCGCSKDCPSAAWGPSLSTPCTIGCSDAGDQTMH